MQLVRRAPAAPGKRVRNSSAVAAASRIESSRRGRQRRRFSTWSEWKKLQEALLHGDHDYAGLYLLGESRKIELLSQVGDLEHLHRPCIGPAFISLDLVAVDVRVVDVF